MNIFQAEWSNDEDKSINEYISEDEEKLSAGCGWEEEDEDVQKGIYLLTQAEIGNINYFRDLDQEVDLNFQDQITGKTALHIAAENGNLKLVQLLLKKGAARDLKDNCEMTPIELAVQEGKLKIFEALLTKTTPLNRLLPITIYNEKRELFDRIYSLIKQENRYCDIDTKDTLLHISVTLDNVHLLKSAIHHVNVNAKNSAGKTAIEIAVEEGKIKIFRELFKEPKLKFSLENLLKIAKDNKQRLMFQEIYRIQVEHELYQKYVRDDLSSSQPDNVNTIKFWDIDSLCRAVEKGNRKTVKKILHNGGGADINAVDSGNRTPLYYAIKAKQIKMIELLLKSGAKKDRNVETLLNTKQYEYEEFRKLVNEYCPDSVGVSYQPVTSGTKHLLRHSTDKSECKTIKLDVINETPDMNGTPSSALS